MSIDFYPVAPSDNLKSIVKSFFVLEYNGTEPRTDYLLPDGFPSFFYLQIPERIYGQFHGFEEIVHVDEGLYVGYSNTLVGFKHQKMKVVGASLYPIYLGILFGKNPYEFTNKFSRVDEMDELKSRDDLFDLSTKSSEEIIGLLEKFVLDTLQKNPFSEDFIKIHSKLTEPKGHLNTVDDVAGWLGHSTRHTNSLFKKYLGMSPKKFINLVRFNHALKLMDGMVTGSKLAEVAHETGYHDQAHFIRDFKAICGKTPKELAGDMEALASNFRMY